MQAAAPLVAAAFYVASEENEHLYLGARSIGAPRFHISTAQLIPAMAPKPSSSSYNIAHFHELFSSTDPSWDSSDLTKGMWYFALEAHLPAQDQRYETLMTKGFVLSKGIVHVVSQEHLIIVRDRLESRTFTFEEPELIGHVPV